LNADAEMNTAVTPYDELLYPGRAYEATHPTRLATVAALYGMNPAPVSRCRVMELGCGCGQNLIPMAYQYPDSEFIGIDLSARAIAQGNRDIGELGLRNIELRRADLMEIDITGDVFDYIIAHGVYSWVPQAVREKMLSIFGENLAPHGVAYVSYNAHPGSHLRDLVRDMMLFHVRDFAEPQARVAQARAILKFLAEASAATTVHGAVMRDQLKRVASMADEVLFHDDLNDGAEAFLLHRVVADANRHGLQYLGDANLARRDVQRHPESARAVLEQFPDDQFLARDQYQDFIDGYGFRRTLLCRGSVALRRKLEPDCIKGFHLACSAAPALQPMNPDAAGVVEFKGDDGLSLATDHRPTKAALQCLSQRWPEAVSFGDLVNVALERVSLPDDSSAREKDIAVLTDALFRAVCAGHVELYRFPPKLTAVIGERPEASLVARMQAKKGAIVTNLRHGTVQLDDEIVRMFVGLVDGTRNIDRLVVDLQAAVAASNGEVKKGATDDGTSYKSISVSRADVERNLKLLAGLALLVQ
jgi:SAM-dependent methyltransferase